MKKLLSLLSLLTVASPVLVTVATYSKVNDTSNLIICKTQQDTIYLDENGVQQTTNETNLSNINSKEIIQIGFYINKVGVIQVVSMPKTIEKVPSQLPKEITSLRGMFADASVFNGDLSLWDTSNVRDMSGMFYRASVFNGDISEWDTSNVTDMRFMFYGALVFNGDLSAWDTSKVTNMRSMFANASIFSQDLSAWDTSKVRDMSSMFYRASVFNYDLSKWNTSNVTSMRSMFEGASKFNQDLSKWDTANVTLMTSMFNSAEVFDQDLSKWNVAKVPGYTSDVFSSNSAMNSDKLPKFNKLVSKFGEGVLFQVW